MEREIQEAKNRYSKKSIETQSKIVVNTEKSQEELKERRSPAIIVQDRINSIDRKEGTKSTEEFIRKFKEDVAQKFRLAKDSLNGNRS